MARNFKVKIGTLIVPDGWWVLECHSSRAISFTVIGEEAKWYLQKQDRWVSEWLLVSPKPFGVVSYSTPPSLLDCMDEYYDSSPHPMRDPEEAKWFTSARQVHKGELGQYMPVDTSKLDRRPRVAKEKRGGIGRQHGRHKRGWRRNGWMNLGDISAITGMSALELINRFFAYSDPQMPCLKAVFTDDTSGISRRILPHQDERDRIVGRMNAQAHGREPAHIWTFRGWNRKESEQLDTALHAFPNSAWVMAGFGNAIMRMVALGHIPALPKQETQPAEAAFDMV